MTTTLRPYQSEFLGSLGTLCALYWALRKAWVKCGFPHPKVSSLSPSPPVDVITHSKPFRRSNKCWKTHFTFTVCLLTLRQQCTWRSRRSIIQPSERLWRMFAVKWPCLSGESGKDREQSRFLFSSRSCDSRVLWKKTQIVQKWMHPCCFKGR